MTVIEELVLRHLRDWASARSLAQKRPSIARQLSLTTREVEMAIQALRVAGEPICSSSDGYWISDDPAEVEAMVERLRHRVQTQCVTLSGLMHAAKRMRHPVEASGQVRMF